MVDSKEIFKELLDPEAVESLYDDEDEELCGTEDENCEDNEVIEYFILPYFFLNRSSILNP